jgi:hypothetical protein
MRASCMQAHAASVSCAAARVGMHAACKLHPLLHASMCDALTAACTRFTLGCGSPRDSHAQE